MVGVPRHPDTRQQGNLILPNLVASAGAGLSLHFLEIHALQLDWDWTILFLCSYRVSVN